LLSKHFAELTKIEEKKWKAGPDALPAGAEKRSKVSSSATLRSKSDAQNHHWNFGLSDLWRLG